MWEFEEGHERREGRARSSPQDGGFDTEDIIYRKCSGAPSSGGQTTAAVRLHFDQPLWGTKKTW